MKKETKVATIRKLDFEAVDAVNDALFCAFYDDENEDDVSESFVSLWTLFLVSAGWTSDEYWAEYEARDANHSHCCECGAEIDDDNGCDLKLDVPKVAPESKPN